MNWLEQQMYFKRRRRVPDPYRVLYMDMETLRSSKLRNWDDPTGTRDGTITGMTIAGTGMPAKSGYFNGSAYVSIGAFGLSGTALTFAAWVRCSLNASTLQTIISDATQSGTAGFIWCLRVTNGYDLYWEYADGTSFQVALAANFFSGFDNTWTHVAVVCDYAGKTCKFYRNGALFSTAALTGTPLYPSSSRTRYLGAYSATPQYPLTNGYIDEVQLWTRALTDAEVLAESRLLPALP
jgi:hypothetical protein